MFCDEYFLLRRQNRRDLRALADGDREVLRGIARRLDDATWNSYEAQRVLRDLIDLAARAGQEGRPLTEALGKDPAGTVDELCAAIDPGTPLDRLLTWWPAAGAASGAFLAGMAVRRQSWPLWGTAAVFAVYSLWLLASALFRRQLSQPPGKGGLSPRLLAGLGVLLALALVVAVPRLVRPVDVPAPTWALSLGFFALAAASWAARTARYNACARRRPWRESAQAPRAR